jgi:hypothetical protein
VLYKTDNLVPLGILWITLLLAEALASAYSCVAWVVITVLPAAIGAMDADLTCAGAGATVPGRIKQNIVIIAKIREVYIGDFFIFNMGNPPLFYLAKCFGHILIV